MFTILNHHALWMYQCLGNYDQDLYNFPYFSQMLPRWYIHQLQFSIQNLNYIFFTDTQTALSSTMKTDIKYVSTSNTHWLCLLLQFFFLWSNPSLLLQPFSFQISIEYCRMSLSTCCCFSTLTLIFFISIFLTLSLYFV